MEHSDMYQVYFKMVGYIFLFSVYETMSLCLSQSPQWWEPFFIATSAAPVIIQWMEAQLSHPAPGYRPLTFDLIMWQLIWGKGVSDNWRLKKKGCREKKVGLDLYIYADKIETEVAGSKCLLLSPPLRRPPCMAWVCEGQGRSADDRVVGAGADIKWATHLLNVLQENRGLSNACRLLICYAYAYVFFWENPLTSLCWEALGETGKYAIVHNIDLSSIYFWNY